MAYVPLSRFLVILLIGLLLPVNVFAQTESRASQALSQQESQEIENISIALEGNDVLTYFLFSGPQKGNEAYQAVYQGKRYLFVSAENQTKFAVDPEKYLPEFDEYCGCAASEERLVKADPKVFKITEGKLVLFEDTKALSKWNKNEAERYQNAQKFWKYESEYSTNDRLKDDTRVRLFTF